MRKEGQSAKITPGKLQQFENPRTLLTPHKRNLICMKDIIPSPKRTTKLNLTLKSCRIAKSTGRSHHFAIESLKLPSFLFDFLDEQKPQAPKPNREPLNIFETLPLSKKQKIRHSLSINIDEEKLPEIKDKTLMMVRDTKTTSQRKRSTDNNWYKPYVIEISPRASVTLYGVEPINIQDNIEEISKKKHRKFATAKKIRNLTGDYKKKESFMQPVVINSPAKSFAEKLQRVQDIAKEAEENFINF